jgi:hypothetical protein
MQRKVGGTGSLGHADVDTMGTLREQSDYRPRFSASYRAFVSAFIG